MPQNPSDLNMSFQSYALSRVSNGLALTINGINPIRQYARANRWQYFTVILYRVVNLFSRAFVCRWLLHWSSHGDLLWWIRSANVWQFCRQSSSASNCNLRVCWCLLLLWHYKVLDRLINLFCLQNFIIIGWYCIPRWYRVSLRYFWEDHWFDCRRVVAGGRIISL